MKLTIEGEPKEIAALIREITERQIDEDIVTDVQSKVEELTKALNEECDRIDITFRVTYD